MPGTFQKELTLEMEAIFLHRKFINQRPVNQPESALAVPDELTSKGGDDKRSQGVR